MKHPARLTRKQTEVYEFLLDRASGGGPPPTLDELCARLALRSRGSMHKHVRALVGAGLVHDMGGKQRGVRLVGGLSVEPLQVQPAKDSVPDTSPVSVPLFGKIAAGRPIEAVANQEELDLSAMLRGECPCFALRVEGDSMVDEGILDGDFVIVEQREHARNGEIVVALVDGEDATLKRIIQRPDQIELWPAHPTMDVMRYSPERVQIQGVVVGQMRSYR